MTYEQKWTCMVIIVAICAAISLLLSADRYVVYTDRGYPIIMVDGKEYHPEDMP